MEPITRLELVTSPLPRECSTTELYGRTAAERRLLKLERVMGIEPTPSAWKAEVLPLNYTRLTLTGSIRTRPVCRRDHP